MQRILVFFCIGLSGCSPILDAQLRLLDASRKGLTQVQQSLEQRQQLLASLQATRRTQLDAAFDADVKAQSPLTDAWVIQARQAYAAATDAFATQQQKSQQAADADAANLAAVDTALAQIESLDQAQLQFKLPTFGGSNEHD